MTKMRLFVASLALPALLATVTPAFAQEAQAIEQDEMVTMSPEQDEMSAMIELADLPVPGTPVIAVIDPEGVEIAEGPGGHGGPGGEMHHHGPLSGPLALTDDQIERIASINDSYRENVGPKMLALHTAMHHMMRELGSSSIDSSKVKKLEDDMVGLKGDVARLQGDKLLAVANVFTPDQRHALHMAMLRRQVGMMMGGGHKGHHMMMHHHGEHPGGGPGGHEGHEGPGH